MRSVTPYNDCSRFTLPSISGLILTCVYTIPRAAEKADADADGEDGKKKKGGIQVPEEWPWEEAKKVFEHPDVTPAAELEVGREVFVLIFYHRL